MAATAGKPEIVIGFIDGPVAWSHPDLQETRRRAISAIAEPRRQAVASLAYQHGTFIAGILCAKRGSRAPAISPDCTVVSRPIFGEVRAAEPSGPAVTPQQLAAAITETVAAGVHVINLSLGLSTLAMIASRELTAAFDAACRSGVLVIVAAGNHGRIGPVPLFTHPWVIPVVACHPEGRLAPSSNLGPSVGKNGLMAPGVGITSTSATGGYTQMSGTSVAAPFVTGAIALLWSLFPRTDAAEMRSAILRSGARRSSITPPLLNAEGSWQALKASH